MSGSEELIHWIECQDDLKFLRKQAESSLCEYKPEEASLEDRIRVMPRNRLGSNTGVLHSIASNFWVSGRSLRGKFYSSPELDSSLSSVGKVTSISTLWDFLTTLPIIFFASSFLGGVLALPTALVVGYLILWASNASGENSTNARKGSEGKARASLAAFVVLSLAKTIVSGVGTDLLLSQNAISEAFATKLVAEQQALDKKLLEDKSKELSIKREECNDAKRQLSQADKFRDTRPQAWDSLYVRAYGTYADQSADRGLSPKEIIDKYGANIPPCKYVKAMDLINSSEFDQNKDAVKEASSQSKIGYLMSKYPNIYGKYFRGSPKGITHNWHVKGNEGIKVPRPEFTKGDFAWVDGSTAIEQATQQFFNKLFDSEKITSLGFSLFSFTISVVLSSTAAIMLYQSSNDKGVRASFSPEVAKKSNELLSKY